MSYFPLALQDRSLHFKADCRGNPLESRLLLRHQWSPGQEPELRRAPQGKPIGIQAPAT